MRRRFFVVLAVLALVLAALVVRREKVALAAPDDDFPEVGATDMKTFLEHLQTKSGANWVLLHGQRAFVVHAVLEDCVLLTELETRDGEPMETSDSTPSADRVKAIWNHGRSEPSTFRRIATYMVPFRSILRVTHRSLEGHERFTVRILELD